MASAQKEENLLLIDGSNLGFRMFFALEMTNMRNSKGHPTWAVYGTFKAIFDAIEKIQPTAIAVAFDKPEPSFRHETFEDYKANRPDEMPEELKEQWEDIKNAFHFLHLPVLEEAGLEADDLIGIMAKKAEKAGKKVTILSGDRDLFQLVNENTSMAVPQRGGGLKFYAPADVHEQMGVWPKQITDYKGIAGDSSDNIPGVRGLGPKTAVKLLEEYGDLETVYKKIDSVHPAGAQKKLIEQEESARLSKYLGTLLFDESAVKDADLDLDRANLTLPDVPELIEFFKELEFNSFLKRLPVVLKPFNGGDLVKVDVGELPDQAYKPNFEKSNGKPSSKDNSSSKSKKPKGEAINEEEIWGVMDSPAEDINIKPFIVLDESTLDSMLKKLEKAKSYAVDLETTGLNTLNCKIVGWAFSFPDGSKKDPDGKAKLLNFYIPILHQNIVQLPGDLVSKKLKPILEDESKLTIIQNAKFEKKILSRYEIQTHSNFFDTMLASYVQNPSNKHGLKQQSRRILNLRMTEIDEIIGTGRKQITMDQAPIEKVAPYAAADSYVTYKLYEHYSEKLSKTAKKLLEEIDFPLIEVLTDIELAGVKLDTKFFEGLNEEVSEKISELQAEIWKISGKEFNISSPKQLSAVLFEDLGIEPVGKKTKTGAFSTSSPIMEELLLDESLTKKMQRLIEALLEFRTLTKLYSTYIDNLPKLIAKETGRLHSDFNQVVTSTGRLSSSNPNLQNIPIRTELGRQIRKGFIAKDSKHVLLTADYSQIELRILAHMADAENLIDAFKKGQDIHKRTAMEILGKKEEDITPDERAIGKTLNFALIYMQGPFSTAKQLGITLTDAKKFIDKYFRSFPSIRPFMDEVLDGARENSYVETMFGRRRYFRNLNSRNKILQKEEERQAFNAPLQGTAADIMKKAMVNLQKALEDNKLKSKIILQVHDELVLEVPKTELEEVRQIVEETMSLSKGKYSTEALKLKVPLVIDIGVAGNWLDCK